jgi:hypothetical protein
LAQGALDVAGLVPGLGEPADALNGVIWMMRGDGHRGGALLCGDGACGGVGRHRGEGGAAGVALGG